jgi:hypothetical protein
MRVRVRVRIRGLGERGPHETDTVERWRGGEVERFMPIITNYLHGMNGLEREDIFGHLSFFVSNGVG